MTGSEINFQNYYFPVI
ncbi:unnamed protein product [Acanthoscelides obtectus]|uniref:Uncharacterized protein n=1 Tax=Acanthoscelides obtectus TaxID=200917 RepID=A0A9P0JT39_ACAOB|nr:unnamed protein product [Acanthoscelides obtectus]CAK1633865.1 hypothetical protein AOBTE_LOCUS8448 [Acanthoscelides obtectus]